MRATRPVAAFARNSVGYVPVMIEREPAVSGKPVVASHTFRHDRPAETQILLIVGRTQVPPAPLDIPGKRHLRQMPVHIRQIRARVIAGPDHPVDRVHPLIRRLSRRIETVLALE